MSRFKITNPLPSPHPNFSYSFSVVSEDAQRTMATGYRRAGISFTTLRDACEIGGQQMTLIHFYVMGI